MVPKAKRFHFSDHRTRALTISILLHIFIIIFLFFYTNLTRQGIPKGYEGIQVNLGIPVTFDGQILEQSTQMEEIQADENQEENDKTQTTLTDEESTLIVKSDNEKPASRTIKNQSPQNKPPVEDFSQFFKSSSSEKSDKNQGDPLGTPGAEALRGISKGSGRVGGGLDNRGVMYIPEIIERSQKSGRVVVRVCVDSKGKVKSAKFTQLGSTTIDADLVEVAEFAAKKYIFAPGEFEEQCGTITINFIVQ